MSVASSTKAFCSRNSDVNLFIVQKLQSVSVTLNFCQHFADIIENESVKIIEGPTYSLVPWPERSFSFYSGNET